MNDFFLHAWEQREKFVAAENTKAHLLVSFKRFLINHLRKSFPFKNIADYPEEPMEHSYEDYIICLEENEALKKHSMNLILLLPARQKELLMSRFYENMSYEEIAEKNALNVRTVYNKIHLALKRLRSFKLLRQIRKNYGPPFPNIFHSVGVGFIKSRLYRLLFVFKRAGIGLQLLVRKSC